MIVTVECTHFRPNIGQPDLFLLNPFAAIAHHMLSKRAYSVYAVVQEFSLNG
jgi:hypothetical protein